MVNALIEKLLVKLGNFSAAEARRRYAYILTSKGIARKAALARAFLLRKMDEYESLKQEIEALTREGGGIDPLDLAKRASH